MTISGREFAAGFSVPQKLTETLDAAPNWDDIVQLFVVSLGKYLASQPKLGAVRAALTVQQQKGVHLCVLFTERHDVVALEKLKKEIPELILLVSSAADESDTNYEVLRQFEEVYKFFRD